MQRKRTWALHAPAQSAPPPAAGFQRRQAAHTHSQSAPGACLPHSVSRSSREWAPGQGLPEDSPGCLGPGGAGGPEGPTLQLKTQEEGLPAATVDTSSLAGSLDTTSALTVKERAKPYGDPCSTRGHLSSWAGSRRACKDGPQGAHVQGTASRTPWVPSPRRAWHQLKSSTKVL